MTSNVKITTPKKEEEPKGNILGPGIETKLEELKLDLVHKIEKELTDSQNARNFIAQKYDELCSKISFLTDLEATVTGFRSDVKTIERHISELVTRVDDIEKRTSFRDSQGSSFLQ